MGGIFGFLVSGFKKRKKNGLKNKNIEFNKIEEKDDNHKHIKQENKNKNSKKIGKRKK